MNSNFKHIAIHTIPFGVGFKAARKNPEAVEILLTPIFYQAGYRHLRSSRRRELKTENFQSTTNLTISLSDCEKECFNTTNSYHDLQHCRLSCQTPIDGETDN